MSQTVDSSASALAGSRELLAAVLAHLGDGIVVHAPNGDRLYANDEAARLTGFASAEELLAAPPEVALARFEIFHADGTPMQRERAARAPRARGRGAGSRRSSATARPAVGPTASRRSRRSRSATRRASCSTRSSIFRDVTDEPVFAAEARRRARERRRSTARRSARRRCSTRSTTAHRSASASGTATCATCASTTRSRDQRAPARGSRRPDVRRGRAAPRAGARVDRAARARDAASR